MKKYKYLTVWKEAKDYNLNDLLNKYGEMGYKLHSIIRDNEAIEYRLIFEVEYEVNYEKRF